MAPTVYVKNPGYCLNNVGHVRKDLLIWMNKSAKLGKPLNIEAFQYEADRLLIESE